MENLQTLLIVEDEEAIRDILKEELNDLVQIVEAGDGEEAIDIISNHKIDVILSDLKMPKVQGLELLETLRERFWNKPFIILTGCGEKQAVIKALELGAFSFLEKPFELELVRKTVSEALRVSADIEKIQEKFLAKIPKNMSPEVQKRVDEAIDSFVRLISLKKSA